MERELAALADDADEEADGAGEQERVVRAVSQRVLVDPADAERAGGEERDDDADHQPDVAGSGCEERLVRRVGVGLVFPPVTDQGERAEPDALPPDQQLDRVVGDDEQQHRRREQAQHGEVVRVAAVTAHVGRRVHVHEQRDEGDHEGDDHAEAVDACTDAELHHAVLPPRDRVDDRGDLLRRVGLVDPLRERDAGQHERRADGEDPDLGALARQTLPHQEDEEERDRGESRDDPGVVEHGGVSPSAGRPRRGRHCGRCGR